MRYTRGRLGKNGRGIFVPFNPVVKTSREGIGHETAIASS